MNKKRLLAGAVLLCGLALIIALIACLGGKTGKDQPQKDGPPKSSQPLTEMQSIVAVAAKGRESVAEKSIFPAQWKLSREVETAITKGALAKVTLRVVDSTGNPVPSTRVKLNFTVFEKKGNFSEGLTDANGLFTAERESMSDCNWFMVRDGYYRTDGRHSFALDLTNESVKDGRWMPWNPILEVVLKEKRKPVPMINKRVDAKLPKGETLGFDCMKGDWTPPYGNGKVPDFTFLYQSDYNGTFGYLTNSLLVATGNGGGYITYRSDIFSEMWSTYDAPETGYRTGLQYRHARTPEKIHIDVTIPKDTYLVFICRVEKDQSGRVLAAHYGKFYQFEYGEDYKKPGFGFVKFTYYFNPTPNDRNLESDGRYP